VSFKSPSDNFHLSPNIDEGFRLPRSRDFRIFKIGKHEIEFRAHEEIHIFLEMSGVSPPIFLSQSISFGHGLSFCFREVEDTPELFFKEEDFFYWSVSVDVDHFGNKKMFFVGPSGHMFEESQFHFPEFFPVKSPAFSLEGFTKLDQSVFKVVPKPLHDMEVIVLIRGLLARSRVTFMAASAKVPPWALLK